MAHKFSIEKPGLRVPDTNAEILIADIKVTIVEI
jgi:hypothetical protein